MILEIDAGNTALKWRIVDANGLVLLATQRSSLESFEAALEKAREYHVQETRISCVAREAVRKLLGNRLKQRLGLHARFAQTQKSYDQLTISYPDPGRLGVDRWLAMLAAQHCTDRSFCVIDCGSAITADIVEAGGKHLGGYIVPGLNLMKNTLLGDTGQILMTRNLPAGNTGWGLDTDEAVTHGISRMAVNFVDSILVELANDHKTYVVFLTGGDVDLISSQLSLPKALEVTYNADLVLDGLAIALP